MFDSASIIIAGSTGLIGHHLLNFSLKKMNPLIEFIVYLVDHLMKRVQN